MNRVGENERAGRGGVTEVGGGGSGEGADEDRGFRGKFGVGFRGELDGDGVKRGGLVTFIRDDMSDCLGVEPEGFTAVCERDLKGLDSGFQGRNVNRLVVPSPKTDQPSRQLGASMHHKRQDSLFFIERILRHRNEDEITIRVGNASSRSYEFNEVLRSEDVAANLELEFLSGSHRSNIVVGRGSIPVWKPGQLSCEPKEAWEPHHGGPSRSCVYWG